MKKKTVNPYEHRLRSTGNACAESCPACLRAEHFEATGDSRRSPITDRPDLTAEELNARFEKRFGSWPPSDNNQSIIQLVS
jgi:hypothetical protein